MVLHSSDLTNLKSAATSSYTWSHSFSSINDPRVNACGSYLCGSCGHVRHNFQLHLTVHWDLQLKISVHKRGLISPLRFGWEKVFLQSSQLRRFLNYMC
jgi:hypothetical protein